MDIPRVEWAIASQPPVINSEEVHIWRIDLSDFTDAIPKNFQLLSADEQQKVRRYHFETDRNNFTIRRAALRTLLGSYLDMQPEELNFIYNNFDKPALEVETPIRFNASSSNGIGVVAIKLDARIGIDIEFLDTAFPKLVIAEKYFSSSEVRALHDLEPEMQTTAFFDCWTKKEAYVKAVGDGMSHPLPTLTILSEKPDSLLIAATSEEKRGWSVKSFIPKDGYIASVAYEGGLESIRYFQWQAA
jgi:4'-phosphopantetheinyl transferase